MPASSGTIFIYSYQLATRACSSSQYRSTRFSEKVSAAVSENKSSIFYELTWKAAFD